jgi:hypothetical protein
MAFFCLFCFSNIEGALRHSVCWRKTIQKPKETEKTMKKPYLYQILFVFIFTACSTSRQIGLWHPTPLPEIAEPVKCGDDYSVKMENARINSFFCVDGAFHLTLVDSSTMKLELFVHEGNELFPDTLYWSAPTHELNGNIDLFEFVCAVHGRRADGSQDLVGSIKKRGGEVPVSDLHVSFTMTCWGETGIKITVVNSATP